MTKNARVMSESLRSLKMVSLSGVAIAASSLRITTSANSANHIRAGKQLNRKATLVAFHQSGTRSRPGERV